MKLIELNIVEFGCLKDKHITLDDGLNIISGDNESGKSTVMLFIKFMLYGLPRKTAKGTDRDRALSFDGHRAAGTMTLEKEGRRIRIERQAHGTSRISETLKIIDLDTGEQLNGEAGDLLLGVPCEIFENSCSVAQMRTDINKTQAASAVENLLASADESIDVKKICERLDAVRKEYRLNKGEGGILYRTEAEISSLRIRQREATEKYLRHNQTATRLERRSKDLEVAKVSLAEAEERLSTVRSAEVLSRFDVLSKNKDALEEKRKELTDMEASFVGNTSPTRENAARIRGAADTLRSELNKLRDRENELDSIGTIPEDDALAIAGEELLSSGGKTAVMSEVRAYDKRARAQRMAFIIMAALSAISVSIAIFLANSFILRITVFSFAAVFAAAGIAFMALSVSSGKKRDARCEKFGKKYQELESHLDLCLERAALKRASNEALVAAKIRLATAKEEVRAATKRLSQLVGSKKEEPALLLKEAQDAAERTERFCDTRDGINKEIYMLEAFIDNDTRALSDIDEAELRRAVGEHTVYSAAALSEAERTVKFNRAKYESLSNEVNALKETLAGLTASLEQSPVELADRISALEEKLARDTEFFAALMLAKQSIEEASMSMSGNVTPVISRKAGEMLAQISGGRHESVQTTKNLDLSVEQDGFNVSSELLSGGTRDAAYICLRISLMMRLFGEELPPLLLDEALCQLDDTRAKEMLELLDKLREFGLQTLLFTCHGREQAFCNEMNVEAHCIGLS